MKSGSALKSQSHILNLISLNHFKISEYKYHSDPQIFKYMNSIYFEGGGV